MTNYCRIDIETTGKYCEMLALAEFTSRGCQVAIPFGNQAKWDFLVEEDGRFRRVQVKSTRVQANGKFSVSLRRCSGSKGRSAEERTYNAADIDYLVAVCPENRAVWKVPVDVIAGKSHLVLGLDSPCLITHDGAIERRVIEIKQQRKRRATTSIHEQPQSRLRPLLIGCIPSDRPMWMPESTWQMAQRMISGDGLRSIARTFGVHETTVRERLDRVVKRLGREYPLESLFAETADDEA